MKRNCRGVFAAEKDAADETEGDERPEGCFTTNVVVRDQGDQECCDRDAGDLDLGGARAPVAVGEASEDGGSERASEKGGDENQASLSGVAAEHDRGGGGERDHRQEDIDLVDEVAPTTDAAKSSIGAERTVAT